MSVFRIITRLGLLGLVLGMTGCLTVRQTALNAVADMLSETGSSSVFTTENDPELVREALPFGLKVYEMVLEGAADHAGIRVAAANAFISYANTFLEWDAIKLKEHDFDKAEALTKRALNLYLRGRDYALDGLELDYPGFRENLRKDPAATLAELNKGDVPALYWLAAGWGLAISCDPGKMDMVADLPLVEAVARRALALDDTYDNGALHAFMFTFEASRGAAMGGGKEKALKHFDQVVALTKGLSAGPYVTYAATIAVQEQDVKTFKDMLQRALAIDVHANKNLSLLNIIAQEQAQWYLNHGADLFLDYDEEPLDAE